MVRREGTSRERAEASEQDDPSCTSPVGESPTPVSAEAPGSRPQVFGGDPSARAGHRKSVSKRKPNSGEQARGPQHQVKPAASTDKQSESRAAHVTAKATS